MVPSGSYQAESLAPFQWIVFSDAGVGQLWHLSAKEMSLVAVSVAPTLTRSGRVGGPVQLLSVIEHARTTGAHKIRASLARFENCWRWCVRELEEQ